MSGSAQSKVTAGYVLDTSAIVAYLLNEPQAAQVEKLHRESALPFVSLCELYAALWLRFGQVKANEAVATIQHWNLSWVWPTEQTLLLAGRWRALHRLGLGDSLIAALTYLSQMTLVTKDRDFLVLKPDLHILLLA